MDGILVNLFFIGLLLIPLTLNLIPDLVEWLVNNKLKNLSHRTDLKLSLPLSIFLIINNLEKTTWVAVFILTLSLLVFSYYYALAIACLSKQISAGRDTTERSDS